MPYSYRVLPGGRRVRDVGEAVEVPAGTAAEILEAVGTNRDLARAALDVERRSDKPRVTLVAALEKVAE